MNPVYVPVVIYTYYGLMPISDMYLHKSDLFRLIVPTGTFAHEQDLKYKNQFCNTSIRSVRQVYAL